MDFWRIIIDRMKLKIRNKNMATFISNGADVILVLTQV
jgi:hypothetical protein